MDRRSVWIAIYVVAFAIFAGGYLARVHMSPYFPLFVGFCMLYGMATLFYLWRTHGR